MKNIIIPLQSQRSSLQKDLLPVMGLLNQLLCVNVESASRENDNPRHTCASEADSNELKSFDEVDVKMEEVEVVHDSLS